MPPHAPRQPRGNRNMAEGSVVSGSRAGGSQANNDRPLSPPLMIVSAPPPKKLKHQSPQDAIDEFWSKFNSKTPGRASTILPKDKYAKQARQKAPKGRVEGENPVSSYEEAAKICKQKVEKIVKECKRINQKYTDKHFDLEFDLKGWNKYKDCLTMLSASSEDEEWINFTPGSVKRVTDIFENPQFFVSGATANDIRQGRDGDCWLLAALCTLGNKEGLIEKICVARDEKVGVYGFVFHRDGEWISEIVDDKLYLIKPDYEQSWEERNLIDEDRQRVNSEDDYRKIYQTGSGALYFAQCEDPNETWLPLLEKAYAKAHGDYAAIEGGHTGEGLEDLTGGVTTDLWSTNILDKEYFWREEIMKVNQDFLFGCSSSVFQGRGYRKGIYEGHAYSIMKAVEIDGKRLCLLRNPWGMGEWTGAWSDGSKEWTPEWMQKLDHRFGDDGAFWIEYSDLLKKYETFDRTRLFSSEWKVTGLWTSLSIPWSVEYHKTKFCFILEKKANVVVVLSQLDDRYFCGLEGQYEFELSFRIHKAGEEDYIVRSHGGYSMRRSTTAELELEAGEYHVLMKVEATRDPDKATVEEVLRNNVKERRDKLLRIGLAYDLAHAKGIVKETDEEKKSRKRVDEAKKAKEKKEMLEKLTKEKKKRTHNENKEKRKQRAAALKRKEKAKVKAEKAAAKQKTKQAADEKSQAEGKVNDKGEDKSSEKAEVKPDEDGKVSDEKPAPTEKTETTPAEVEKATQKETSLVELNPAESAQVPVPEKPAITNSTTPEVSNVSEPAAKSTPAVEDASKSNTAAQTLEVPILGGPPSAPPSAPPSVIGADFDSDDESDIVSVISEISSGVVEDAIAEAKLLAEATAPPPPNPDDEDEFEKDPWNAVAVVGLRVYSKDSAVSVKVIRPIDEEHKEAKGEANLDVDDSAADATKEIDPKDGEKSEEKKDESSEGSVVVI